MSEKRVAEASAEVDPEAPPSKKQRLNNNSSKSTDKIDNDVSMVIESKSPEKESLPSSKSSDSGVKATTATTEISEQTTEAEEQEDDDIKINDKRIIFLTGNKGKLMEVQSFLNNDLKSLLSNEKLDLDEIQGTPREIIKHKLLSARDVLLKRNINASILVEDTSFILNAYSKKIKNESNGSNDSNNNNNNNNINNNKHEELLGMPGPYVKWMLKWDKDGNESLCKMIKGLDDNKAYAICIFGFLEKNNDNCMFFNGICEGSVPNKPMNGENGFGWDPVFIPNGKEKSFAQMSTEDKNKISHRGIALIKLKEYLEKNYIKMVKNDNKENNEKYKDKDKDKDVVMSKGDEKETEKSKDKTKD